MPASSEPAITQVITLTGDLHARPAGQLAVAAAKFDADVSLTVGDRTVSAKSVLAVMGLGATSGQQPGRLLVADPGHRLVQQQQLRRAGQGDGQLQVALLAMAERIGGCVGAAAQPTAPRAASASAFSRSSRPASRTNRNELPCRAAPPPRRSPAR